MSKNFKIKNGLETTNITASANISASGTIISNDLTIDAITGVSSILNTSLKIGRDSTDLIDFATADNVIGFRVGNNDEMKLTATALHPATNNGSALGLANRQWADLFLAQGAVLSFDGGDTTLTDNGASLDIAGDDFKGINISGNITASGDISSSGIITAEGLVISDDALITDDLEIQGNISGSSASTLTIGGVITAEGLSITDDALITDDLEVRGNISGSSASTLTIGGNTTVGGDLDLAGKSSFTGNITASGNISASGTITSTQFNAGNKQSVKYFANGDQIRFGNATQKTSIRGATATIVPNITASGNISASGTLIANAITLPDNAISGDKVEGGTIASITISQLGGALDVNNENITNIDVNSGTIDGTVIGGGSAAAGTFTTLNATSLNVTSITSSIVTSSILKTEGSNIFGDTAADTHTFNGGIIAGNITSSGKISSSGGFIGGLTGTADVATVATTVTITDNESTNESNAVVFTAGGDVDGGNLGLESDGNLTYNPSTGRLTATQLAGTLQTAAQGNVTSLGTLTTLTVDDITINASKIEDAGALEIEAGGDFHLDGAGEILLDSATSRIRALGNITASNNISASGNLLLTGNATIDGNIDLEGDIDVNGTANLDNIDVDGTANFADNITIAENKAIFFDSTDTFIKANTGTAEDLVISADEDIILAPDDNIQIEHGATTYAEFMGDERKLSITGEISASAGVTTSHITASGNISASGTVFADSFQSATGGSGIDFNDSLDLTGNITASGNISSSGTLDITGNVNFDGDLDVDGTTNLDVVDIDGAVNMASTLLVSSHITASTNISASGTITAGTLDADAITDGLAAVIVAEIDNDEIPIAKLAEDAVTVTAGTGLTGGGSVTLGGTTTVNVIGGTGVTANANDVAIGQDVATTANVKFNHITASGNISSSGNINALTGTGSFGQIHQLDNQKILIGTGNDLQISHNGSDSFIIDTGTGDLFIRAADEFRVQATSTNEDMIKAIKDGGVELYHNNVKKLETEAGGIDVTGHITASGNISASGNILTNGNITAVGTITAEQVTSTDDMNVTDDLIVGGNISGSSTSTGSFGELKVIDDVTISDRLTVGGVANFSGTFVNIGGGFGSTGVSIAADGDISTNGTLTIDGAITASGNISSSGTITALQYGGNVSGSSTSTGSFGKLLGDGAAISNISATVSGNTFATDLKIGRDADNLIDFTTDNQLLFRVGASNELKLNTSTLFAGADDGLSLGATAIGFSDLFLADGAVIGFNNGEIHLTQTNAALVMSGSGATTLEVLGNISGSITSTGSFGVGFFDNKVGIGTTSPGQHLEVVGNISASGTLLSNNINVSNKIVHTADANTEIAFAGDKITITAGGLDMITLTEDTSDQIVFGDARTKFAGNITASANISASGIITAEGLVISDDALITDDLEVRGNTSGSSTSTGSFGNIVGNSISLPNNSISGDVVEGGTIAAITITDLTTTTLNVTHLTSSFVTSSTIITEGSNIFGDAAADTHTFNGGIIAGNITASGDISASGTIIAEQLTTSDDLTVGDDIFLSDSIVHSGDTDTNIAFSTDQITFKAGDVEMIRLVEGSNDSVVINDLSADVDFRVESNGNVNMLKVDGGTDKVGIGTGEPTKELTVAGDISASGDTFFGNASTDSHTITGKTSFIGNITASGNISSSGTIQSTGNITTDGELSADTIIVGSTISHIGDTNTLISFGTDTLTFKAGNEAFITITEDGSQDNIVIGDGGDIDFHVKAGGSNTLFAQGSSQNIGIGTATPTSKLQVVGDITSTHITASGNYSGSSTSTINVGGNITTAATGSFGEINLDDDKRIKLGTGDDLQIYHDGSDSFITDAGGQHLRIHTNQLQVKNAAGNEELIKATQNEGVKLFHNNNQKFETMIGGIDVTGHITASGNISASGTLTVGSFTLDNLTTGNITASGNISSSGNITSTLTGSFGGIKLNDTKRIQLGTSNDLQIFHDGSNSNISDSGTGALNINGSVVRVRDASDGNTIAQFTDGAGTLLKHNNSTKFETSTTGINVTGHISASSHITASGNYSGSSTSTINVGGNITTAATGSFGEINLDDNKKIKIGTGDDLQIFHDATDSIITNATGDLKLTSTGDDVIIQGADDVDILVQGGETAAKFGGNGGVDLYHNNVKKFETTALGIDVTGNIDASSHITASGNISSSGIITGEGLVISDDALITDDLEVQGNISGSSTSTITIGGKLQAGSKSFLINKPEGGKLEYGVLEGQQNDVFFRGELKGDNVIYLPQEWEWLVNENTITTQLTSIGKYQELYFKEIKDNKVFIGINGMFKTKENIHCYYIIHGTRKDIELIRNHQ